MLIDVPIWIIIYVKYPVELINLENTWKSGLENIQDSILSLRQQSKLVQ